MELANRGFRWVPVISGMFGHAFGSAKHMIFAHGPAQSPIRPGFASKVQASRCHFACICLALFFSFFSKMCSPPSVGSTFLKNGLKHFAFKNSLFGPLKPSNDDSSAHFFANFMKMCSPPSVGNTFPKNRFCNDRVQEAVSIPKLASKPPLMGGYFRLVLCKK